MGVANNYMCYRQLYRLVSKLFTIISSNLSLYFLHLFKSKFFWKIFIMSISINTRRTMHISTKSLGHVKIGNLLLYGCHLLLLALIFFSFIFLYSFSYNSVLIIIDCISHFTRSNFHVSSCHAAPCR